jgi:CheY-like chemotaxis protein
MSRETVDHAFEPFFTTKSRGKGTGLGLAMVYGFARQSSGAVHIYSELGFGTKVSIYLPVMATLSQVASVSTKKITLSTSGGIVLVVDDEVDLLEIAVSHLVEMGYTPLKAIDGASALDALNQRKDIEMMMTDIIMPGGMDGVELARQACVLYPDLKIIFMSGFPSKALEAKSMSLVNRPLLHKPYLRASFAAVVHGEMEA